MFKRTIRHLGLWMLAAALGLGCHTPRADAPSQAPPCACSPATAALNAEFAGHGALLATRFGSFEAFKRVIRVEYFHAGDTAHDGANWVRLRHCSQGQEVTSILAAGVSQDDIMAVKTSGRYADILGLARRAPFAFAFREDMQRILTLARRVPLSYGEGDPAFYDLAEASVAHINTPELAFRFPKDTTEKGYLNTFNHITAQAFITSLFSEALADLIADQHERKNMRELTTGNFSAAQLASADSPVDNYVDMLNNEWGQALGNQLKAKYQLTCATFWTPTLLADYLNDLQRYYGWAFEIGFEPFRAEDELVWRFAKKLNVVMGVAG